MAATALPKTKILGGSFLLEERQTADVFTPEDFSEQHQMIGQTAEEFAVNEILPQAEKILPLLSQSSVPSSVVSAWRSNPPASSNSPFWKSSQAWRITMTAACFSRPDASSKASLAYFEAASYSPRLLRHRARQ